VTPPLLRSNGASRLTLLLLWPSEGTSEPAPGVGELGQPEHQVIAAPTLIEGLRQLVEARPAVVLIEAGLAVAEREPLKALLAAEPALQILALGEESAELVELGTALRWVARAPERGLRLREQLGFALERRALLQRLHALAAELRSAEQQRIELTRGFHELVQGVRDVVLEVDRQGRILATNAACREVLGYSQTEATSLRVEDLLGPEPAQVVDAALAAAAPAARRPASLVVARRRSGQPFLAELSVFPVPHEGKLIGGRALLRDVGGRSRTEEQLRRLVTFYWSLSSTLDHEALLSRIRQELITVTGVPHHALFLHDASAGELALASADRPAPPLRLPAGPEADNLLALCLRSAVSVAPRAASAAGEGACPSVSLLAPASELAPARCRAPACGRDVDRPGAACPLGAILDQRSLLLGLHAGELPIGVLVLSGPTDAAWQSSSDIAHLALVAQYMSAALNNARLHAETLGYATRLERTLDDLRTTQSKLARSEQLAAFSQIAMGVSHEVRNPLNAISLMLCNLKEDLADPATREAAALAVDPIQREVLRLKQTLDDLLAVARHAPRPPELLDLNQLIQSVVETLRLQLEAHRVQVVCELAPGLPPLAGDPSELRRALLNLALNASEAMPAGGTLTFRTSLEAEGVRCDVEDTGVGLAPEHCERVFTPFFTTKERGTGLGLSLVQRVIHDLGGRVSLSSELGRGSQFALHLPVARAMEAAACGS